MAKFYRAQLVIISLNNQIVVGYVFFDPKLTYIENVMESYDWITLHYPHYLNHNGELRQFQVSSINVNSFNIDFWTLEIPIEIKEYFDQFVKELKDDNIKFIDTSCEPCNEVDKKDNVVDFRKPLKE